MTTKRSFNDLVSTWAKIFKSVPDEQMEDLRRIEDQWNEADGQHSNPSRAEIAVGRPQEASGGGAERMVREYSDPAPQMGMAEQYAEMGRFFRDFAKAQERSNSTMLAGMAALGQIVGKAETVPATGAATAKADPESLLSKAEIKIRKARTEMRKADMVDEEDKEEREEKKSFLEQASVALKSAKRLLAKAEEDEWESEDEEDRAEKARSDWRKLTKALRKAEDEGTERTKKEMEEMEKAAAAAKAAPEVPVVAATPAPTVKAEEEKKDEDETAKAAAAAAVAAAATAEAAKSVTLAPVDPGLRNQLQILETSVKSMMEVVMAGSKGRPMPTFSKATPFASLAEKVETAIEDGTLDNPLEIMKAQTLVTHVRAVQSGHMDAAVVDDEITKAPDNVRQLFMPAQAAA